MNRFNLKAIGISLTLGMEGGLPESGCTGSPSINAMGLEGSLRDPKAFFAGLVRSGPKAVREFREAGL